MCLTGFGQTNSTPAQCQQNKPDPTGLFVTNYTYAAENFRRVNGQLYNTDKSQLWETLDLEFVSQTNGITIAKKIKLTPIYKLVRHESDSLVSSGNFLGSGPGADYSPTKVLVRTDREELGEIAVRNCDAMALQTNEAFKLRATKTGTLTVDGKTLVLWDRGTVNRVPVVTRKL